MPLSLGWLVRPDGTRSVSRSLQVVKVSLLTAQKKLFSVLPIFLRT